MPDIVETYFPYCRRSEGGIPHLYLDLYGHLTIGYGRLVFHRDSLRRGDWHSVLARAIEKLWAYEIVRQSENEGNIWATGRYAPACRIPGTLSSPTTQSSVNACDPRDALIPGPWGIEDIRKDQSEMTTEAENMLALPYGKKYSAAYYSPFTSFAIARESEMVRMAYDSIRDKIREVKSQPVFREFDAIPLEGQLAVLDLAYQGGAKGIAVNYRSGAFGKAVSERRWYRAAKLCPGPEDMWPPKERQELRRKWLMEAFKKDPKTAAEDRQEYATDLEKFQNTA